MLGNEDKDSNKLSRKKRMSEGKVVNTLLLLDNWISVTKRLALFTAVHVLCCSCMKLSRIDLNFGIRHFGKLIFWELTF